MTDEPTSGRPAWSHGPLYQFMLSIFPEYRTILRRLDVERLGQDLNRSHEAVYKWLRSSRLDPKNAKAILELALTPANAAAIRKSGRTLPQTRDFDQFVYPA